MQYRKRMLGEGHGSVAFRAAIGFCALPLALYAEEVSCKTTEYVNFRPVPYDHTRRDHRFRTSITVTDTSNSGTWYVRLSNGST